MAIACSKLEPASLLDKSTARSGRWQRIGVGIPRDRARVGVTQDRVEQHTRVLCLDENTSVPEITPPDPCASVSFVGLRRHFSQKRAEQLGLLFGQAQAVLDAGPGLWNGLQTE